MEVNTNNLNKEIIVRDNNKICKEIKVLKMGEMN